MTGARLPSIDEVLALDLMVLRGPDGAQLDADVHRQALAKSLARSEITGVWRESALVAYAYMWPLEANIWFVGGFSIHPAHRNASVVATLMRDVSALSDRVGAETVKSHVLKANSDSMRFHRRLGFSIEQESDRAVAFTASATALAGRVPVRR